MNAKLRAKFTAPSGLRSCERIYDLPDFVKIILDYFPNDKWIFRGQGKLKNVLVPKSGRAKYFIPGTVSGRDADLVRFDRWEHQAVAFSSDLPSNKLERLAYAQHFGLATRLLDWTLNAATALYFATEDYESRSPGAVFVYPRPLDKKDEAQDGEKIEECRVVKVYQPRPITSRIIAQDGMFTIHPRGNMRIRKKPFNHMDGGVEVDGTAFAMCVPADKKRKLQEQLRAIGVLRRTLFPDIEGLSVSINCVTHWMAHPRN